MFKHVVNIFIIFVRKKIFVQEKREKKYLLIIELNQERQESLTFIWFL